MNRSLLVIMIALIMAVAGTIVYLGIAALEPETYATVRVAPEIATTTAPALPAPAAVIEPLFREIATSSPQTYAVRPATEAERAAYQTARVQRAATAQSAELGMEGVRVTALSKTDLLVNEHPSAYAPGSVWLYSVKTKRLAPVIEQQPGAMARAMGNGTHLLLFAAQPGQAPALALRDRAAARDMRITYATLPGKCALDSAVPALYCAVPKAIPPKTVLPDDYFKRAFYTDDRIVRIDFKALEARQVASPAVTTDAYDAEFIGGAFIFTNRRDGAVYAMTAQ
jgi:hypothetical protein